MRHFLLLLAVFLFILTACENTPPSPIALIKEIDIHGDSIHYQMDTVRKVKMGFYKRFHKNGQIFHEQEYIDDTHVNVEKFYYENGQLKGVNSFDEIGDFDGPTISYYISGKKESEGTYVKGSLEGEFKNYYENGQLKSVVYMKNSTENGPFEEYNEKGVMVARGTYKDKREHCLLELYDEENKGLKSKLICDAGKCCTIWTATDGYQQPKNELCKEIIAGKEANCDLSDEELGIK